MLQKLVAAFLMIMLIVSTLSGCSEPASETTVYERGEAGNTAFNICGGGRLALQDGTAFYYEPASVWNYGGGLFRSNVDGTEKKKLAGGVVESINAVGETVYFVRLKAGSALGELCSVPAMGGKAEKIADGCRAVLVMGEAAYYIGAGDHLFSLDLVSGQTSELMSAPVLEYSVEDGAVYCRTAEGIVRMVGGGAPETLAPGPVDAFCEQAGTVCYSVYDEASGANAVTILDAAGSKSGFVYSGSRVTRLSPYRNAFFLYTDADELVRVRPDGTDPVRYGGGRAVQLCLFADRAFAWSKEKPLALLDAAAVGFETVDVYAASGSIGEPTATAIGSAQELSDVIAEFGLESLAGENLEERYNDDFFRKKALVLALARVQLGTQWVVTDVSFSGIKTTRDDSLTINVAMDAEAAQGGGEEDCGGCLVEISKNDLNYTHNAAVVVNDVSGSAFG